MKWLLGLGFTGCLRKPLVNHYSVLHCCSQGMVMAASRDGQMRLQLYAFLGGHVERYCSRVSVLPPDPWFGWAPQHGAPGWFPPWHPSPGAGAESTWLSPGSETAEAAETAGGGARRGGRAAAWMEGCKGEGARVKLKHGRKRSIFVQSEECGTIGQQPAPACQWAGERRTPTCV